MGEAWFDQVPAVEWTGSVVYVVGGDRTDDGVPAFLAYVPADDAWVDQPMPPGGARAFHTIDWTGQELLLWGGDGAADVDLPPGLTWRPPS